MDRLARKLLWVDSAAGTTAGVTVLSLHGWLASLHGLAPSLVLVMGAANVAYGTYSGTLAVRASRGRVPGRRWIDLLIGANAAWGFLCIVTAVMTWSTATAFGHAHLLFEGAFVASLAALERRYVRPVCTNAHRA